MKKLIAFLTVPVLSASMFLSAVTPISAQAQTSTALCYVFTHNMGEGRSISSADATALAQALVNADVWTSGTPITTYNDAVASAVSGFQEKYAAEILTPNGLSYGTGYVGAATRNELNSMYGGCGSPSYGSQPTQNPVTFSCPTGWVCTPATPTPVTPTQPTNSNESITINNPGAGGVYDNSGGKPNIATITWTSTGLGNNPVGINLLSSTGSLVKNIVDSIPNTGSYTWAYDPTIPNGTYAVQVYVAGKGVAVGNSGYFQIVNSPASGLSGNFTASPISGQTPLQVTFSMNGSDVVFGTLNFGDGTMISENTPSNLNNVSCTAAGVYTVCTGTHTYVTPGTYTATLSGTQGNQLGTVTITVNYAGTKGI